MNTNQHAAERSMRIVFGFILFVIGFWGLNWFAPVGAVMFASGLLGFCPIYALFRIDTSRLGEGSPAGQPSAVR